MIKQRTKITSAIIALVLLIGSAGSYYLLQIRDLNGADAAIARFIDIPIARINDNKIGFRQFYSDFKSARFFSDDPALTDADLLKRVWRKIKEEYALRAMAQELAVTWNDEELARYEQEYFSVQDTSSDFYKLFAPAYIREHIVLPQFLRDKITKQLILSETSEDQRYIQDLYSELTQKPDSFELKRTEYLAAHHVPIDENKIILSKDDLTESELQMVQPLREGDLTPIVASGDGYRIYRVINYFSDPVEAWQLSEFFVPSNSFNDMMNRYLASERFIIYTEKLLKPLMNS